MSSRSELWAGLEPERHFRLIDEALDAGDAHARALEQRLEKKMTDGFARCEEDSKGTRRLLIGLLVAIVGSSVAIMLTVLAATGGAA